MRFTINSRKFGPQTFWANEKTDGQVPLAYVYLEDRGPGTTGSQICEGGGFMGNTVMCNGTQEGLERAARRWWKQRLRDLRAMGGCNKEEAMSNIVSKVDWSGHILAVLTDYSPGSPGLWATHPDHREPPEPATYEWVYVIPELDHLEVDLDLSSQTVDRIEADFARQIAEVAAESELDLALAKISSSQLL